MNKKRLYLVAKRSLRAGWEVKMLQKIILLTAILCGVLNVSSQTTAQSSKQLAWDLGDTLSLAVIAHADGVGKSSDMSKTSDDHRADCGVV